VRGRAYWVYLRDQAYPAGARHGLIPPNESDAHLSALREQATTEIRRQVLARHDKHCAALRRGDAVRGVRLQPHRDPRDRSGPWETTAYVVGGLPGLYYRDVSTPLGETPGEPAKQQVRALRDAVIEIRSLTLQDLKRRRELYEGGVIDEVAIAERVAELLMFDQRSERQLRRLLDRAREFEFVHLGTADADGMTPAGKRLSPGALERHYGRAA
jgi:hypothetical protein